MTQADWGRVLLAPGVGSTARLNGRLKTTSDS